MTVNVDKTKIMFFKRPDSIIECIIEIGDNKVEQAKKLTVVVPSTPMYVYKGR